MTYQTISELSDIFHRIRGYAPNQLWAHPSMIDYLKGLFGNTNGLNVQDPYLMTYWIWSLELKEDDRIMPGVIYLDKDGQHTSNAFRKHYESLSIDYGVLSKLAK